MMIKFIARLIVCFLSYSFFTINLQAGAPSSPQAQVPPQEEDCDEDDDEDCDVLLLEEDVDDEYDPYN